MIVDHEGRPLVRKDQRNYGRHGASHARKSLVSWQVSGLSADDDITLNLDTLRARSRDLYMGTPLAAGALKTMRTNIIGSGLMLSSQPDAELLRLTPEQAAEWKANTEREFALWCAHCDAGRSLTFYQLQSLVLMSALMSGDCFVALPFISRPESPYGLKVYVIESDRVCNPVHGYNGIDDVMEGVELGKYGEPVAYWIAKYHPYAVHSIKRGPQEWKRVTAFGARSGRRNILHIMPDYERPGQRRGVPVLAPVIEAFKQLGRYTDAELQAAVISGLFTGFVTTSGGDTLRGGYEDIGMPAVNPEKDAAFGNGTVSYLNEGESISFASPGRPNSGFGGFVEAVCRQVGAALEIPYELLVKNFTASYSASRASLLEAWKMFRMRRQWIIDSFTQPVYEEWLAEAVALGRVPAPGFFEDHAVRRAWTRAEWSGDAQGQLDPLKEAQAAVVRIDNGLSTREKEAAELTGLDINFIAGQLAKERELLGLGGQADPAADAETAGDAGTDTDSNSEDAADDSGDGENVSE